MCGIAGYVDFDGPSPNEAILRQMANALRRRGPDASGTLIDGPCGLAHTRLSIIDLAGSRQPMRLSSSDVALVFNGEIYNYRELRDEIAKGGGGFETDGDTEVLLRLLDRDWSNALPSLDGMFGFGGWHRGRQALLLGRDRFGEKPLFYATPRPGLLVFGSEIKALLCHPDVDRALDLDGLRQALRFRAVYGHGTLYGGISQVPPGHWLEFSSVGRKVHRYFRLEDAVARQRDAISDQTSDVLTSEVQRRLERAIESRLVADVPVGAFLSGGLDSSLVVAVMRGIRGAGDELSTFAVGFEDDPHSELSHASAVADAFQTQHHEVLVGPRIYADRLAELSHCRDAPMSEPADVAVACMSRTAKEHVKVVLSGEGADEIFGGYPKYSMARIPRIARAILAGVGANRVAAIAGSVGMEKRRALVAARALANESEVDRLTQWFSYLHRSNLDSLLPGIVWSEKTWSSSTHFQASILDAIESTDPLLRMQLLDCLTWLPSNLLERGDRMTMAEGLEARPPFLEEDLATFGLALPRKCKVRGRRGKVVLRTIAESLLPAKIVNRKKWGFRVPLAQWFRGELRDMLHSYLQSPMGLCGTYGSTREIESLLDAHASGRANADLSLWTLLSAEVWYQDVFLAREGGEGRIARDV